MKKINPKSDKMKLITKCESLLRKELIAERGNRCEICGKPRERLYYPLSLFHILPKSRYPRLRLYKGNLLLACWSKEYYMPCCHNLWHAGGESKKFIEEKIKELKGEDYEKELLLRAKTIPKLDMFQINLIYESLKNRKEEYGKNNHYSKTV